jgi:hypothetical protein
MLPVMQSSPTRSAPRRVRALASAAATVLVVVGIVTSTAAPASAAPPVLRGCSGQATSISANGTPLSTLVVPAPEEPNPDLVTGTVADPFRVTRKGTVQFAGNTDRAVRDNTWQLSVFGVPVRNGADPNDAGEKIFSGQMKIADEVPFRLTGLYRLRGSVTGDGGRCSGSLWVRILGDPTGSGPWFVALGLIVLGGVVLLTARPRVRAETGLGLDEEALV